MIKKIDFDDLRSKFELIKDRINIVSLRQHLKLIIISCFHLLLTVIATHVQK